LESHVGSPTRGNRDPGRNDTSYIEDRGRRVQNNSGRRLQWLASLLSGLLVNGVIAAYKARLDAENSQDAKAADLAAQAIAAEIEAREAADAVILAEQGRWYTAFICPLLALPVIIYLWKVIVWDKVLPGHDGGE
jgi:hypothetical protein